MTKTQVKVRLREILASVGDLRDLIEELQSDVQDVVDEIEPYEGKDELTEAQAERQEWFEEVGNVLEEADDKLSELEWELDVE